MREAYERSHRRRARSNPAFPARMVLTVSFVLLGDRAFLTPSPADSSADLTPTIEASGPHDFAVRGIATRQLATLRPSHPASNVRDDRDTPLVKRGGTARTMHLICGAAQRHGLRQIGTTGKSGGAVKNVSSDEQLLHDRACASEAPRRSGRAPNRRRCVMRKLDDVENLQSFQHLA
jgi:hypothetical protein